MVMPPIISKIHVILSKCDNENIQIHISLLLGLKFCTKVKNKYGKGIFDHFCFLGLKSLDFRFKLSSMIVAFGAMSFTKFSKLMNHAK
jgi:hypothetical protein